MLPLFFWNLYKPVWTRKLEFSNPKLKDPKYASDSLYRLPWLPNELLGCTRLCLLRVGVMTGAHDYRQWLLMGTGNPTFWRLYNKCFYLLNNLLRPSYCFSEGIKDIIIIIINNEAHYNQVYVAYPNTQRRQKYKADHFQTSLGNWTTLLCVCARVHMHARTHSHTQYKKSKL